MQHDAILKLFEQNVETLMLKPHVLPNHQDTIPNA
jgi:hypothetical protein